MKNIYARSFALLMTVAVAITAPSVISSALAQSTSPWNPGLGAAPTGLAAKPDPANIITYQDSARMTDLEKPTTAHEVALLYYKMGGVRPNFEE